MADKAREGTSAAAVLIGAFDALMVSVGVMALILGGTTLSWWIDSGATHDWVISFRDAANIWFAVHGVSIDFAKSDTIAAFSFSALPLGSLLVIFGLGWRGGKRLAGMRLLWPGWLTAGVVYALISVVLFGISSTSQVSPNTIGAYLVPAISYTFGVICGSLFGEIPKADFKLEKSSERVKLASFFENLQGRVNWVVSSVASPALRVGTGFVLVLLAISAISVALLLAVNWLGVIEIYERLQGGIFGGFGVTLAQLAIIPNLIFYVLAWIVGAGFTLGTGSSVSPLGTTLGPIPTIPVFSAIPTGDLSFGLLALAIPLVVAIVLTAMVKQHAAEARHNFATPLSAALTIAISIGLVASAEVALLAFATHMSIGPGRMQDIGASPLWVAVWTFAEVVPASFVAAFYSVKPVAAGPIPEHLKR